MTRNRNGHRAASIRRVVRHFLRDDDGAVTVDWVALVAFTVLLGMGAAFYVATSVPKVAGKVGDHLETTDVMPEG